MMRPWLAAAIVVLGTGVAHARVGVQNIQTAGGVVGQMLHFRLLAIGFDRTGDKADLEMQWEVFDAKGTERLSGPDRVVVRSASADEVKKARFVAFSGGVILNRPGTFLLRIA